MVCDPGRTTILFIIMECKLNAVFAFASEKKRQTNKSLIHRKSLSVSSLKRARLIINLFRLPSYFPAFWPFRLNSSPSFGFFGVMDVSASVSRRVPPGPVLLSQHPVERSETTLPLQSFTLGCSRPQQQTIALSQTPLWLRTVIWSLQSGMSG